MLKALHSPQYCLPCCENLQRARAIYVIYLLQQRKTQPCTVPTNVTLVLLRDKPRSVTKVGGFAFSQPYYPEEEGAKITALADDEAFQHKPEDCDDFNSMCPVWAAQGK